jgi:hypothetical protein
VLVDVELSGLLIGATLATRASDIYRALIESTAFGSRIIIEALQAGGVKVERIVACGGSPEHNRLAVQIFADVTGLDIRIAASPQTPALGSAMFGAVAAGSEAGGHDTIIEASRRMAAVEGEVVRPIAAHQPVYDVLFDEYVRLHDWFGRDGDSVMKRLKRLPIQRLAGVPEPVGGADQPSRRLVACPGPSTRGRPRLVRGVLRAQVRCGSARRLVADHELPRGGAAVADIHVRGAATPGPLPPRHGAPCQPNE